MQRQSTEKRRRQIAEAALAIIAEQGLGRFTTAALAAEIGVAEGTIFRHFESKSEIIDAAVDIVEELFGELPAPGEGDPLVELRTFFLRRSAVMQQHPGIFRILFSDQLAQAAAPETVARIEGLKARSLAFVRRCLERAVAGGLTRRGLEAAELFPIVHGAALALAFSSTRPRPGSGQPDPARVWRALESMIRR